MVTNLIFWSSSLLRFWYVVNLLSKTRYFNTAIVLQSFNWTDYKMENEKVNHKNFIQKNPNAMGAIYLIIITIALMLFNVSYVWLIPLYFAEKSIRKANKNSESKKLIRLCYALIILIVILALASIYSFVIYNLNIWLLSYVQF